MSGKAPTIDYDPYEVLGLAQNADQAAVKKAFRKAALKWHPDKNPDPKAADMFRKIQEASELLLDTAARAAYDHVVAAKAARKAFVVKRRANEDAKRRKFREDLERREAAAGGARNEEQEAAMELAREIARLRKEGSRLLAEENERLRRKMEEEEQARRKERSRPPPMAHRPTTSVDDSEKHKHTLKLKWESIEKFSYDLAALRNLFSQYGRIALLASVKKNIAVLEFESIASAMQAENEQGDEKCPIKVTWLTTRPDRAPSPAATPEPPKQEEAEKEEEIEFVEEVQVPKGFAHGTTDAEFEAFEAVILAQMNGTSSRKRPAPADDHVIVLD